MKGNAEDKQERSLTVITGDPHEILGPYVNSPKEPYHMIQLPVIDLCGTSFIIDIRKHELRQQAQPTNRISIPALDQTSEAFVLKFDAATGRQFRGSHETWNALESGYVILLPCYAKLDPLGCMEIAPLAIPVEDRIPPRELPTIEFCGIPFVIDIMRSELREVANPANRIDIDDLLNDGDEFIFCFDKTTRNSFHGGQEDYEIRKSELEIIRVPGIEKLDPVGFEQMVTGYPWEIVQKIKAAIKIIPRQEQQQAFRRRR